MAIANNLYFVALGDIGGTFYEGTFDSVKNDSATVFTTITADVDDTTTTGGVITGAVGDAVYFGCTSDTFNGVAVDVNTAPVGGVRTWEYWNGSTWAALSISVVSGNANLTADTTFTFTEPTDWATTTVDTASAYWIRGRVTTVYTTAGTFTMCRVARNVLIANNITLYHAATTDRIWRTAYLRCGYAAPSAGCATTRIQLSVKLGSATIQNYVVPGVPNSAESFSDVAMFDVSDYFNAEFGTGTSQTISVWMSVLHATTSTCTGASNVGGAGINGFYAILMADVDYNTSNTTITKTALIPLECGTSKLTNVLAEIGTNQIPVLVGGGTPFLPESSVVVRHTGFWIQANYGTNAAGNYSLRTALDAEGETTFATHFNSTNAKYFEHAWPKSFDTGSVHAFKARSTVNTSIFSPSVILMVAYDCDPASSTQLISKMIPYNPLNSTLLPSGSIWRELVSGTLVTPESSPSLKQSAVMLYADQLGGNQLQELVLSFNEQSTRQYATRTDTTSLISGPYIVTHRIDSGGASGAALTLQSGWNTLACKLYHTGGWPSSNGPIQVNGLVFLNYHASKPAAGQHIMSRTRMQNIVGRSNQGAAPSSIGLGWTQPTGSIYHTNYFMSAAGIWMNAVNAEIANYNMSFVSGSNSQKIYRNPPSMFLVCGETSPSFMLWNVLDNKDGYRDRIFKLHPTDPGDGTFDINLPVEMYFNRRSLSASTQLSMTWLIDYHGMTWTKSLDVSGYAGTGANLTVNVYHKNFNIFMFSEQTTAGGTLTITGYDPSETYYAECFEDATHVGRSADFVFDNS